MGKPIIMGRKTWESLPKRPLAGRKNIILTRDTEFQSGRRLGLHQPRACPRRGAGHGGGGAAGTKCVSSAARSSMKRFCRLRIASSCTEVNLAPQGDSRLDLDLTGWREISSEHVTRGPKDDADFIVRVLERP